MRSADTAGDGLPRRGEARRLALLDVLDDGLPEGEAYAEALHQAVAGLTALGGCVHLYDRGAGVLRLMAGAGLPGGAAAAWQSVPADSAAAPARAVREGAAVWRGDEDPGIGAAGTVAVPLAGAHGPVGALTVFTGRPGRPRGAGFSFLASVASWIAGRLERSGPEPAGAAGPQGSRFGPAQHGGLWQVPAASGGRSHLERIGRVGELTEALSEAVTAEDVAAVAAERILPAFGADGLIVQALDAGRLHVVGSAGYPRDFLRRYLDGAPVNANTAVADVLRRRTPRFVGSRQEFARLYPHLRHTVGPSGKNAWALLPLLASGRAIGSCAVSFARPRTFTGEERALLIALSGLVAQALDRARLYDVEHHRAQRLQRALLPQTLPRLPAVTAAARYLPAGRGAEVGGDWYDVIALSADRVALVIGDVMGHGIAEAATMGRLRTAVRTLADLELEPDEILGHLNDVVSDLGHEHFATCLYAVFDPVGGRAAFARAGHPAPVLMLPDGTTRGLDLPAPDPPLGAGAPPFEVHERDLPPDAVLALCTDGLLAGAASGPAGEGPDPLAAALAAAARRPDRGGEGLPGGQDEPAADLELLCDRVVAALLPDPGALRDDAALLVTRLRHTAAADVAAWPLPLEPEAAGQARALVRRQLSAWGLDDLVDSTELLVSELVGNAVRYAVPPVSLRLLRSRSLVCEVSDGSLTTPRIRRAAPTDEGGRGLQLVAALSRRWGTRYVGGGKCIWSEQSRATA